MVSRVAETVVAVVLDRLGSFDRSRRLCTVLKAKFRLCVRWTKVSSLRVPWLQSCRPFVSCLVLGKRLTRLQQ